MAEPVKYACTCGKRLLAPPGAKVKCPKCGLVQVAPGGAPAMPPPVRRRRRRRFDWTSIAIGILGVGAIGGVVYFLGAKIRDDMRRRKAEEVLVAQQEAVRTFGEGLAFAQEGAPPAVQQYTEVLAGLASGSASAGEVSSASASAAEALGAIQQQLAALPLPEGPPQQVNALLGQARDALAKGYGAKQAALQQVAKCLKSPTPENLQALQQNLDAADTTIDSAATSLAEARKLMGVSDA